MESVLKTHGTSHGCCLSSFGAYVASANAGGKLHVWSYDNQEHLAKLDLVVMSEAIHGIAWDVNSNRITIVGE
jgi:WD40 repeat protein